MKKIFLDKTTILLLLLIIVLYLALRLPNLTSQPIFTDEAIYIRWAQVMKAEPTLRFLPLSDGKTPLFMWIMMPVFKLISDPLLAGRALSVAAGLMTLLGVFVIGRVFFNSRVALLGAFLMAITPFIVFFDRMALVDTMLSAFTIWTLFIALLLTKYHRIDLAMVLGYVIGGAMLTKTPGVLNIYTLPFTALLLNFKPQSRLNKILKLTGLWAIACTIALFMYNILRLGPGFVNLSSRNQDYIHSPLRLIQYPLDPFIPHLKDLAGWIVVLITLPQFILILGGLVLSVIYFKKNRLPFVIALWSILPLLVLMSLLQTFTARYILFTVPPLILLGAWFLDYVSHKTKKISSNTSFILVVLLITFFTINFHSKLLFNTLDTPLPKNERMGYLEDWTAGYNFKEIAEYLKNEAKISGKVVVGTEGSFGTLPDGLQIYLDKNLDVIVIGGVATVSAQIKGSAFEQKTYFVANKSRFNYPLPELKLIKEYPKSAKVNKNPDAIMFYEVLPIGQ